MSDYCVYRHIFPNGKSYIGISKDAEKRWNGGAGYNTQPKMARAINKYGWDNVKHEILSERLTKELAQQLEKHYIAEYDSIRNGYNTSIGGDEVNTTYLSSHVLFMIRESKRYDKIYGFEPGEESIVVYVENQKFNKDIAEAINYADKLIAEKYNEYKLYHHTQHIYDLGEISVDCYWWTLAKILEGNLQVLESSVDKRPYWWYALQETAERG